MNIVIVENYNDYLKNKGSRIKKNCERVWERDLIAFEGWETDIKFYGISKVWTGSKGDFVV